MPTSKDNISHIKFGNESAFNKLFDEYYKPLCFFCNSYILDFDKARSLVQEVFVEIWIKKEKLKISTSIKNYLYTAVKNKSIDYLRTQKTNIQISDFIEEKLKIPFRDLVQEAEIKNKLNKGIDELPEKCREIFLLCRFEGLKYKEIAEKLNISVKTVEMQMGIALKRLRSKLSDYKSFNFFAFLFIEKK